MSEKVKCPICGARLFDKEEDSTGSIFIKCSQCRKVARIRLDSALLRGAAGTKKIVIKK